MPSLPYSFTANTTAQSSQVNSNFSTLASAIRPTFVFTVPGTLSTGTSVTPALVVNNSLTISKVYAYAKTAPTGAAILVDINKGGTSIWSTTPANRVTVAASANLGTQTSFDTSSIADEDILTIDIDQVGSTIAGADLTVEIKCE